MRNTIRTAFGAALALAAAALCALPTAPTALAEGESTGVTKVRLGSLKRDDLVVVDVTGVPGGGGTGGVDTNAVRDIVREELGDLSPDDIGALPADYEPPVLSVNGKDGDVELGPDDIGALPDTYVPPVTSVNGKTGDVVVAVSDVAGAVTTNDVESIVGRHYETNTSVRIGAVEGRVSATERWQYADGVTRSAVESGFTSWAVEFTDPPAGSSPPYDAVVAQAMVDGDSTGLWYLFSPTDTVHSADTALTDPVPAPAYATNLTWTATTWGPVTATRVRVPTARELDAKAETKDLQAATTSLSNDVSRLDEALAGTKSDLAAVAEAKADRVITEYELAPPRMDTNDVWVVDLDDTVLHFSGEDAVDGFQTWAGTNDSNSVWVCEDGDSNVLARAVSYLLEVTVGSDPVVSSLKVMDVATGRRCGLLTSQFGTAVIAYPPETLPMGGFGEDDLRYEYDASAVPAYSKVLLSYRDAGNGNAITNAASIGRGRRRRIETGVVYGTGLEKAVDGLRDDLVSRRAAETGFTEWAIESDRPLGEDVVPGLVSGVPWGSWSLFPAGSADRSSDSALTRVYAAGGDTPTNLSWSAEDTPWGVAVRATRVRVPTMQDLKTRDDTASDRWDATVSNILWLADYATNNFGAIEFACRRVKDLEEWRHTNSVSRAAVASGFTEWAVTPMWPLGRVIVDNGSEPGYERRWGLFRPDSPDRTRASAISADFLHAGSDPTNLMWAPVSVPVAARWTNELSAAGFMWDGPYEGGIVTARLTVVATRLRVPTMHDIRDMESTASSRWGTTVSNVLWLTDYATNNYKAVDSVGRRVRQLEAWQYTDAVTRADIERGMTDWAVTPMWPFVRCVPHKVTSGDNYGKWGLFLPDETAFTEENAVIGRYVDGNGDQYDEDTELDWGTVSGWKVDARWTNELVKAGYTPSAPSVSTVDGKTVTNVTVTLHVKASRIGVPRKAVKRYPLFIIDLNPGETRNWCHIELKATTNNFTHATASNMIFFTSSTCNQADPSDFGLTFDYDWCRLYIMSKRTHGGSGDVRAWTRIKNTGSLINLEDGTTYAPLTLLVIVDPAAENFKRIPGFAKWLREDNDELTWSYVRIGREEAETDQDGKQCWRPAMPVRWYEKLPSWAEEAPTAIDNSNIAEYAVPWEAASAASTSNVLETAKTMFRGLADEQVYEPAGYSDFTWSSDRADIVEALGDMQPSDYWDDGDYREWYLSFSIGPTNYWGYAYDAKNAPQVTFSLWGEYYDYDSDMYYEDYDVTVLGRRKVSGYSLADPVDTFAHQRELTTINASLSSVRNYVDGETKVLRTGEPGQLGTGWGYVSHSITNDHRRWRFRVPKWNIASGMPARSLGLTQTYRTVDDPSTQNTGFGTVYGGFMTALPSWFPQYTLNRRVLETRGIYGTDACQFADYVVGLWPLSEDGTGENAYAARYSVMHTSASPMRFVTTLLTNDLHSSLFRVDVAVSGGGTVPGYFRYVDLPPVTNTVIRNFSENRTSYSYGNNKYVYYDKGTGTVVSVLKAVGFIPSMAGADPVTTENSIPLKLSFISDQTCDETHTTYTTLHPSYPTSTHVPYTNSVSHSVSVTDMLYTMSLSIPCSSATTFEDVTADYYKLLSTLDSDRHLYYDSEADVSYRVTVSNGCFYAEKVMDGNWQRGGL